MRSLTCIASSPSCSVDARLGFETRDGHRPGLQPRPTFSREGQGVLEPVAVVALREVLAVVGAAALGAGEGGSDGRLGAVEQVADLTCLEKVRIEDRALVLDADALVALLQVAHDG